MSASLEVDDWIELGEEDEDGQVEEYDLTSTPNDFNVLTIFAFIESGSVKIPGFQRNYVWDIKRASKLIESLILGLPVPQVFLYEEGRNSFLVIDGQQRLLTIYFFMKQRFPRKEKRAELRRVFAEEGKIPDELLFDDRYFETFNLRLPDVAGRSNKFARLNYATLGEYRGQFELRTIRNVIVKQITPSGDASIYEMFNRLNTGGINLTPQEIRSSLYHSAFYDALFALNMSAEWRDFLGRPEPDIHMRDVEVLLRALAMWVRGAEYAPSMVRFLNDFSKRARKMADDQRDLLISKIRWFLAFAEEVPREDFFSRQGKFMVTVFEAVFAASCRLADEIGEDVKLPSQTVSELRQDPEFQTFSQESTTDKVNVLGRLRLAHERLRADLGLAQ